MRKVADAVIKAVAQVTGINIRFFARGRTICETRRVLRNERMLEVKSIKSDYTCKIDADDIESVANINSAADLQAAIEELNSDMTKAAFEEELKKNLIQGGIDEGDIHTDFATSTDAQAAKEFDAEDNGSDDGQTLVYVGLGVAAVVGVVALVGFLFMNKKPASGSYDHKRGNDSSKSDNDTFNNKFNQGL